MLVLMRWKEIDLTVLAEVPGQYLIIIVPEAIRPTGAVPPITAPIRVRHLGPLLIEVRAALLPGRPVEPIEVLAQHDLQVELIEVILVVLQQDRPVAT